MGDYPRHKLVVNRLATWFINVLFHLGFNDSINAFKAYRSEVIQGVMPILSSHFNITVELPLKAITRGYAYTTVPINWYNRTTGVSKLKIKEMGSRYLFIMLDVWLERLLSRGDYVRQHEVIAAPASLPAYALAATARSQDQSAQPALWRSRHRRPTDYYRLRRPAVSRPSRIPSSRRHLRCSPAGSSGASCARASSSSR